MEAGDWTPALWRSPELAKEAWRYANHEDLNTIEGTYDTSLYHTSRRLSDWCKQVEPGAPDNFPVIDSKGTHGQQSIKSQPDTFYARKDDSEAVRSENNAVERGVERIVQNAGYLLVTVGQAPSTARATKNMSVADSCPSLARQFKKPKPSLCSSIQLQADSSYCATQEENWLSPYTALKPLKTCASPM